jgi:hypothetical protein
MQRRKITAQQRWRIADVTLYHLAATPDRHF